MAKLDFLEEDDAQDQKDDSPLIHQKAEEAKQKKEQANAAPVMLGGLSDPTILKAQLRDTRNQVITIVLTNFRGMSVIIIDNFNV